jgi:peptidoglycan/LPS O-acetylase OafA/YrhL
VPSWTISAEWAAYLAFPLFCPFVARLRSALVALVGAAALCVATIYALRALGFGESLSTDNPGGLVRIAGEFGAGCLLCRVFQISGRRAESWSLLTFPALAALAAVLWLGVADPWAVPAFGALVLALAADRGVVARLLGTRWSLFWGCASYSLYMTHWMVLGLLTLWMSRFDLERRATTGERVLWLAAALAAVAAAAILTWRYVEEPGRRVLRRLTSAGARSPSPAR